MNRYLEQFNQLKPQERRFVVGVGLVVFLLLNFFFVWPEFGDLDQARVRMDKAQATLAKFKAEIARKNSYQGVVNGLQKDGMDVPAEDQAIHFESTYHTLAAQNKVVVISNQRASTRTNEFFLEREEGINVQAGEKELVDFLYSLGSGDSMIRVRSVNLHPDPSHMQLNANLTIVASYQKATPPPRSTAKAQSLAEQPAPPAGKSVTNKLPSGKTAASATNKTARTNAKNP